jgi:hypothetical protein
MSQLPIRSGIMMASTVCPTTSRLWYGLIAPPGLIRWKIVIHGFIDGKTRFIVGLRAHNNNRADTVFQFFRQIIQVHGCPSRVRGDHGVENVKVASFMEEQMGPNRGSYIWGRCVVPLCPDHPCLPRSRSVHNTRIERLWYDMTEGFGRKWKELFYELEDHHGLNALSPSHIWLLQTLFLPAINEDALAWAEVWNSHKIQLDGERRKSPRQLFMVHSITDGVRGLRPPCDEGPEDYTLYGVDWEAVDDPRLRAYRQENGGGDEETDTLSARPEWINAVACEPPNSPLTDVQFREFMEELTAAVDVSSNDTSVRRLIWANALELLRKYSEAEGANAV